MSGDVTILKQRKIKIKLNSGICFITKTEVQVLVFVINGYTIKQIAQKMHLKMGTIAKHLFTVRAKLNAKNVAHAAAIFVQNYGFVDLTS